MDERIETSNLSAGYGNKPIVSDMDLCLEKGQVVCLIGANGSGKSTVLKTITRQIKKVSGSISIFGRDEEGLSDEDIAKHISMVTTEHIHPELMTCRDVVATGRYPYTGRLGFLGKDDIEKIDEAINMLGIENISGKYFSKVSDGQRQRVMLARAICQDTDILILDEPTSFLDIEFKIDILRVIRKLSQNGKSILMSIHELELVPAIGDKVLAIYDGKIYKAGSPSEILTGENLEKMYEMKLGTGDVMAAGLWQYAASLKSIIWQK